MSRSRRKIIKFSRNDKFYKRLANKQARKSDLQDGGQYKKVLCSWNICDYPGTVYTKKERQDIANRHGYRYLLKGVTK